MEIFEGEELKTVRVAIFGDPNSTSQFRVTKLVVFLVRAKEATSDQYAIRMEFYSFRNKCGTVFVHDQKQTIEQTYKNLIEDLKVPNSSKDYERLLNTIEDKLTELHLKKDRMTKIGDKMLIMKFQEDSTIIISFCGENLQIFTNVLLATREYNRLAWSFWTSKTHTFSPTTRCLIL